MKQLLIIGTLPESAGIGGVTVHMQRLLEWLDAKDVEYTLCDYKTLAFKKQIHMIMQHKNVHLHVSHPALRIMYALIVKLMGKKLIFTVHGNIGRFNCIGNLLDRWAIRLSDVPITINRQSYDKALKLNKRTQFISAFIPPVKEGDAPECAKKYVKVFNSIMI